MRLGQTERLYLEPITQTDAPFILELLNDPGFIQNIGDRNVRTIEDAQRYILEKFTAVYEGSPYGMYKVCVKGSSDPMGLCGLVDRPSLDEIDIGFAFLPQFRGKGYGQEAAGFFMKYGFETLKLSRIVAITALDNQASINLLERIGLRFDRIIDLDGSGDQVRYFIKDNKG